MYKLGKYKKTDIMSELISENYRMLLVISRFGIKLGLEEKNIEEVCFENQVDTNTFLAVVNLLLDEEESIRFSDYSLSIRPLILYLHNSHNYFLDYRLPDIRTKLIDALEKEQNSLSKAIINYFDKYVAEVRKHMMYEEKNVFPYVQSLLNEEKQEEYNIGIFKKQHNRIEALLTEFKQIIIKYYPAKSTNEINSVLFDIFNCENDLASHNLIEDKLFVPAIVELEQKNKMGS